MESRANTATEEISFKDLILRIKEFRNYVLRHWIWLMAIGILVAAYFAYDAWKTETTFDASLTFMVNEDEGNSLSSVNAVLGRFGIRQGKKNLDKILELSKSRKIIQNTLFRQETIDGETTFLANHLIDQLNLHENWSKDTTGLKDFYFVSDTIDAFSRLEFKVLKKLVGRLRGTDKSQGSYTTSYDESSGIMHLQIGSPSETFSISFLNNLFDVLSTYYVEQTTEKAQQAYDLLQTKSDSLFRQLRAAQFTLAKFEDENRNVLLRQEGDLKESQLREEVVKFRIMYEEVIKNRELAAFNLESITPYITLIDSPIPPLQPNDPSILRAILLGLLIGGILGSFVIVLKKIYEDIMHS